MSAAKAGDAPTKDEKIAAIHKDVQKKIVSVTKALAKKLKLTPAAAEALAYAFIEAQMAFQFRHSSQLPISIKDRPDTAAQLVDLANAGTFSKEAAEDLVAFLHSLAPADLAAYTVPCGRLAYLETLANTMADNFLYTQASSHKYSALLKRSGELLAKEAGATFAKVWKAKAPASICNKLYLARGQTRCGWLTDAVQGRVNCESVEAVAEAAGFFQNILETQVGAAAAAGRMGLDGQLSGERVLRYTLAGLQHAETGEPVDALTSYLSELAPEDEQLLAGATIVVYRVQACRCCDDIEDLEPGEVFLVNLMLCRPCAEVAGFAYRVPEGRLACTMELQLGTANGFKLMKKAAEAHDRAALLERCNLLDRLTALANGAEGKLTMPGAGKGGAVKGGSPDKGRALLDFFRAIDVMHPAPPGAESRTYAGRSPVQEAFELHTRDRAMPGSRWFRVWESAHPVVRVDGVTCRLGGKPPPLGRFSLLLAGVAPSGEVVTLAEEQLARLPVVKGEVQFVTDGLTPTGQVLGNLSHYSRVTLEYFEHERTFQWVDVTDISITALVQPDLAGAASNGAASAVNVPATPVDAGRPDLEGGAATGG